MSADLIVIFRSVFERYVISQNKAVSVFETEGDLGLQNILKVAPPSRVKAVFIYPRISTYSEHIAMHTHICFLGYKIVRQLPNVDFKIALILANSKFSIENGEYVGVYAPVDVEDGHCKVYKKINNIFTDTNIEMFSFDQVVNCKSTKYILFVSHLCSSTTSNLYLEAEKKGKKLYIPSEDDKELYAGFNWDQFIDNPKLSLKTQSIKLHFCYGNSIHHLNVDYEELPFSKVLELDIEDAQTLTLSVNYETNFANVHSMKYVHRKRRKIKVTFHVSKSLLSHFTESVISEEDPIEYSVFSVDWDNSTKLFSGTLITADNVDNIISECKSITDVSKELAKTQSSTKLRGVIVNYWNTDDFPVDIHRKVVKAMPSPTTKLIVGQIHAYFPLHLQNSGIQNSIQEFVVLTDWSKAVYVKSYTVLVKDVYNYKFVSESLSIPTCNYSNVVIVVDEMPNAVIQKQAKTVFRNKTIHFSSRSNLTRDDMIKYAWQYFNGGNYEGYSIESHPGFGLWFRTDFIINVLQSHQCFCNDYARSTVVDAKESNVSGLPKYFTENPHIYIHYVGFPRPLLYIRAVKPGCQFLLLKTELKSDLIPTATLTRLDSSLNNLPKPFICTNSDTFPDASAAMIISSNAMNAYSLHTIIGNESIFEKSLAYNTILHAIKTFEYFIQIKVILHCTSDFETISRRQGYRTLLQSFNCNVVMLNSSHLTSIHLYQNKEQLNVGESMTFFYPFWTSLFTKHENGWKCDRVLKPDLLSMLNPDSVDIEEQLLHSDKRYNIVKDGDPYIYPEDYFETIGTTSVEAYSEFVQSILNGTNFHGYRIHDYDEINFKAEWDNREKVIHCGVENLPFEVTTKLEIGKAMSLKVFATVQGDKYLIKHFTMKTKKHRRVSLTIKQLNLCEFVASLDVLEGISVDDDKLVNSTFTDASIDKPIENPAVAVKESDDSLTKSPQAEMSQSTEESASRSESIPLPPDVTRETSKTIDEIANTAINQPNNSPTKLLIPPSEIPQLTEETISNSESTSLPDVTLTFTANNHILVNAGPDYTGKPELAAYFRMKHSKFGPVVTIGEEAKKTQKKHPKTVIYDIPGLLAADSDPSNENLTWSFDTSRTADGTLLIHLGNNAFTSPVPLFASVVQSTVLYVKNYMVDTIETVALKLPVHATISEANLVLISDKIGVKLQMT